MLVFAMTIIKAYAWPLIVNGSMRSSSEYGVKDLGL